MRMRSLVRLCSGFSSACCNEGRATRSLRAISAFDSPDLTRHRFASAASSGSENIFRFGMAEDLQKVRQKTNFILASRLRFQYEVVV